MSSRNASYAIPCVLLIAAITSLTYFGTARAKTPGVSALSYDMFIACWHDEASEYHCGGDTSSFTAAPSSHDAGRVAVRFASNSVSGSSAITNPGTAIPSSQVDSIVLSVYRNDGQRYTKKFPNTADAIFLSRFSTSNMLRRYYVGRASEAPRKAERDNARAKAARLRADIDKIWPLPKTR